MNVTVVHQNAGRNTQYVLLLLYSIIIQLHHFKRHSYNKVSKTYA